MKGFFAPRRFGWDCHGLPVEYEVEKAKGLSGAQSIEAFGISQFNEACREIVLRYSKEWEEQVRRQGRWVDFNDTYRTMDLPFMESVWWVFKELFDKGLIYRGYKVMPFSAKLGTPLSNFEAGENYQEVDDPSLTVALSLADEGASLLIWTTTPWTLISNLAIMVGPDIVYVKICDSASGHHYILAKEALSRYYETKEDYQILETLTGKEMAGKRYLPLFPYFAKRSGAFRIILEESVSLEEGTGLVHSAPAFGEVDFYACKRENIPLVCPVDGNGRFTPEIPEYQGLFVKDADKGIIRDLKARGHLIRQETLRHRYPFCWRSDTPLIYKAVATWFVSVEKVKERMVAHNRGVHWVPEHLREGRFGKWLEGARDWAISRNRYWGTPIPIWVSEEGDIKVVGSVAELEALSGQKVDDLHRHFVDQISFVHQGKQYRRIPEVFDCWFESGSMPYAQNHYPFENRELFSEIFPADFIAEGLDQTRGWFYTLMVLSTALFDKPAFRNVVVNGIVLAEDGAKMSKRLQNYPDPMEVIGEYGADAVRLYMMHSPAVVADDLRFQKEGVALVVRQILLPFWNAYSFFLLYARIYHWRPGSEKLPTATMDRWILSLLAKLTQEVGEAMDSFHLSQAVEPLVVFVDQLTNWYIRRCRRRFWEEKATEDRASAFATLYQVLFSLTQMAAPFIPFLTEAIYQNLRADDAPLSVHLTDYPTYQSQARNPSLEEEMAQVQKVVSLGHSLRKQHKIKVRQPLVSLQIASFDPKTIAKLARHEKLLADELNVKRVEFSSKEADFVRLQAKPNFRVLGKKVGKRMKEVQVHILALPPSELEKILEGKAITIAVGQEEITLLPEDLQVERIIEEGRVATSNGKITLALDTTLDEELIIEGLARELINKINTMRRNAELHVSDRISVQIETTSEVKKCFEEHGEMISQETLANEVQFVPCQGTAWDLNGQSTTIAIQKS